MLLFGWSISVIKYTTMNFSDLIIFLCVVVKIIIVFMFYSDDRFISAWILNFF